MKVKSVSSSSSAGGPKRSGGVGGMSSSDFASLLSGQMDTGGASEAVQASAVSNVTGIIPTLTVDDKEENRNKRQRAVNYGNDLLDKLEDIRIGLIKGVISKEKLFQLSQKLRARNKNEIDSDPRLQAIIEDIETRVEVELAKLMKVSVSI